MLRACLGKVFSLTIGKVCCETGKGTLLTYFRPRKSKSVLSEVSDSNYPLTVETKRSTKIESGRQWLTYIVEQAIRIILYFGTRKEAKVYLE